MNLKLKILSYNWHEPYLCLLSKIGHTFLIIEPEITEGNYRRWDQNMRPIPDNVILVSEDEAMAQLDEGSLDLIIAHNVKDLIKIRDYSIPKILVFHNKLTTEIGLGNNNINRDKYLSSIGPLLIDVNKVFISESKRLDWEMDGDVILPGLDVDEYSGYTGESSAILRVGNLIKERDLMMGFHIGESILAGLPSITLGMNPTIDKSRMSSGFGDLLAHYRSMRMYLHTTTEKYEDGYNLSLLEAMAVGMPVITTSNKTSPIINGVNGYQSKNLDYLRERSQELLDNPFLAKSLGQKSREIVMEKFPISKFLGLWQKSIHSAIIQFLDHTKINKPIESSNLINGSEKPLMPSYYKNIRKDILSIVPSDAKNILEIGCAAGMTGNELKKKSGVYVAGVELDHNAAIEAKSLLDDVIEGDIEDIDLPYKNETFDCLLFADILEHLKDPLTVLKKTSKLLKPTGTLIASIPNVQYLGVVSQLIEGNWTYQDEGILDRTHLRFFTYHEIEKLFTDAGYEIIQVHETLDPQYDSAKDTITTLNIGRLSIRDLSPEELRKFFVFQYKISAKLISDNKPKERFSKIKESKMSTTLMLGKSFEDEGKYQDAVKLYSEVGKDQDDYSEILARLGNCFMQLQDPSNAEHNYKKSLELNSDGYVAGVGLGVLELQLKKLNDSIKRFTVLSEKYPDSDKVFSGLGMAYKESRNIKKSIDSFNMALSINIENKSAMSNLLELSYNQNSFDLVEMAMKKYLKINPANTDILIGLAGILFKTNRIDDSRDILSKILEINPIHEDAKDMFNQIESQTEGVY